VLDRGSVAKHTYAHVGAFVGPLIVFGSHATTWNDAPRKATNDENVKFASRLELHCKIVRCNRIKMRVQESGLPRASDVLRLNKCGGEACLAV
jgi:hypothetical protein